MNQKTIIKKMRCPKCAAKGADLAEDNLVIYEHSNGIKDGYCFSCSYYCSEIDDITETALRTNKMGLCVSASIECIETFPSIALVDRNIPQSVTEKYRVKSRVENKIETKRYYPIYHGAELRGYKIRTLPKSFSSIGEPAKEFFGQHLFSEGGRLLIVTAGEEDAMAAHRITELMSPKKIGYASVSLPNGAKSLKTVKDNLEWLNSFEKVVFAVDQEELDLKAAEEYCGMLAPGKGHIARFSEKDASDMCAAKKYAEFYNAVWNARPFKPSGISEYEDLWTEYKKKDTYVSLKFPTSWDMNSWCYGLYRPALFVLAAGTGVGKSSVLKHLQYHVFEHTTDNIGVISLEESLFSCVGTLMGMNLKKRIMLPDVEVLDSEERTAFDSLFKGGRFTFCSSEGIRSATDLYSKIRFMANARDCKYIFVDHLTAVINKCSVSGTTTKNDYTEALVNTLNELCQELKICLILVSHVRKTGEDQKTTYETGKVPDEDSIFGSSAIKQYSYCTLAISRNKTVENSPAFIHVLKDRLSGRHGKSAPLIYNDQTGWLDRGVEPESII